MRLRSLSVFFLLCAVSSAAAQEWPARPVTVIAPSPPGAAPDLTTRVVAELLQASFGKPFVVVNRPGAAGNIAARAVAKAAPDGYTLALTLPGPLVVNPMMMDTGYTLADFEPVMMIGTQASILFVNKAVSATTLEEVVAWIKSEREPVQYAISGIGTVTHLAVEALGQERGLRLEHIGYNGSAEAALAVGNGEVRMAALPAPNAAALADGGKGRMIAITSALRSAFFPEVPTFAESGMPGYDASVWLGLVAPAGTPQPIIDRIASTLAAAFATPEAQAQVRQKQFDLTPLPPKAFAAALAEEDARWRPILARAGLLAK